MNRKKLQRFQIVTFTNCDLQLQYTFMYRFEKKNDENIIRMTKNRMQKPWNRSSKSNRDGVKKAFIFIAFKMIHTFWQEHTAAQRKKIKKH